MVYLSPGDKVYFVATSEIVVPATVIEAHDVYSGMPTTVWHTRNEKGTINILIQDPDRRDFHFLSFDESKLPELELVNQFLWIDEPVGHCVRLGDEIFLSLNEALKQIYPSSKRKKHRRFRSWRNKSIRAIRGTHSKEFARKANYPEYPLKHIITKSN